MVQRALQHGPACASSASNLSRSAGSTEPQFTPTRKAQSCRRGPSARKRTLSCQGRGDRDGRGGQDCNEFCRPRGQLGRQTIVLLQIDRQVGLGAAADFRQGHGVWGVSAAIRTTPAPAAARRSTWATVASMFAVLVAQHALHHDRLSAANSHRADADCTRRVAQGAMFFESSGS